MQKLKRVLLVDDYEADNFLHQMLFEEMACAEQVDVVRNGREALDYLQTAVDGQCPHPELICLDINMPVMNGWEFVEEYRRLPEELRDSVVLMMLTTSLNPDDSARAQDSGLVSDFMSKPLTRETLEILLQRHFPDRIA